MNKILSSLLLYLCVASLHASVLLKDSLNYPYTNGPIAGQGQWYVYYPSKPAYDTLVTNNVIYLVSTNKDSVATPTNGFYNATNGSIVWASFSLTVNTVPSSGADGYFCTLISTNRNYCCNVFVSSTESVVPGTYRLSIANYSVSFSNLDPPVSFPEDLATNVTYEIVIAFDTAVGSVTEGATLMIDPSSTDYNNLTAGDGEGFGFVYGTDAAVNTNVSNIEVTSIGFGPYVNAGISNVILGTTFSDVYDTNDISPPVFGVQPESGTNYSGNGLTLYSLAAGADLTYQWYSTTYGILSDGANFTGSQSSILVVSSLSASDGYYVVATDANNKTATSDTAEETVITTLTPVFFASSVTAVTNTNNLFATTTFTDPASGTGPITYQWYHISTNAGATAVALSGQNNSSLALYLADFTAPGQYYVVASSAVNGGSTATGPTNILVELAPLVATVEQLHNFLNNAATQIAGNPGGTIVINANTVVVSGYVSVYSGYGSSYSEFFIQDTNGYGVEVYLGGLGNTNTPPIGSYVTVSGPLEVYHSALEIAPTLQSEIVTSPAPPVALYPFLGNPFYSNMTANPIGPTALRYSCSLVTFTNVYIYGSSTGGALGAGGAHYGVGGIFVANSYTILYMTVGAPYSANNTKTMEIFQPSYNIGGVTNQFNNQVIPTHCAQLTGVLAPYGGTPSYVEVIPSRYEDYLVASPAAFPVSIGATNKKATVNWLPDGGATYSVYSATSLTGPWTNEAYGLTYYPSNGAFSQPINSGLSAKFYILTSP